MTSAQTLAMTLPHLQAELCLTAGVCTVLLAEMVLPAKERSAAGWAAAAFAVMALVLALKPPAGTAGVSEMLFPDRMASYLQALVISATLAVILLTLRSSEAERMPAGETYAFLLAAALGCCILASSRNLLLLYLGMEIVSYASYLLAGFLKRDLRANEAALKYVLYGAVASGCMLFGISLLYGMAGTLDLERLPGALAAFPAPLALAVPFALVLAGLGFKVSVAPFHQWTPDVYEGAPTPVSAFLSVAPKAAGLAALARLCVLGLTAAGTPVVPWPAVIGLLAALTMTTGNLCALFQTNVKRMLAYSSVAHAGYMLMGLAAAGGGVEGVRAVLFYLAVYLAMNLGAFGVVMAFTRITGSEELQAWKGMGWRHPFLGSCMVVFLMSLTGLPPFGGFVGKFMLFKAAWGASLGMEGIRWMWALITLGLLNSVVSLFYYLGVAKTLFVASPATEGEGAGPARSAGWLQPLTVGALAALTLLAGLRWAPLAAMADAVTLGLCAP